MSFFVELRRRNVFRVAAAYAIVAWILIQVAAATFPQLSLPDWAPTLVTVLLLIGFPIALVLAWAFELTADGVKLTGRSAPDQGASTRSGILDYGLIAGLVLVVAATLWGQSDRPFETSASAGPSIAVLPFADMSPGGDQGYFGDGIAEELLNELTRLDGLRVAGRTSSFLFKDSNRGLREIGVDLGVAAILEGSVRKDGDRVRVTAQLVNSADGYHLWSQTYDSKLEDIFSIQEQIAAAVTGELGVRLGVGGVNTFQGAGTRNVEAYEAYLRGNAVMWFDYPTAIRFFDRAIELDPNYAAAWSARAVATASTMWLGRPDDAPPILETAYSFVRRALELDPNSAQVQSHYGSITYAKFDWIGGHQAHQRSLSLLGDRWNWTQHGNLLMRAGRLQAARAAYDTAEAAEPLDGRPADLGLFVSLGQGRFDEAREILAWSPPGTRVLGEIEIVLNEGNEEAVRTTLAALVALPGRAVQNATVYRPVLESFDSPDAVRSALHAAYRDTSAQWPEKLHDIALLAAYFDDPALALEAKSYEGRRLVMRLGALWYPVMKDARQLPEFKQLVTDLNLVAYWREFGWADLCRPTGADDFVCD